MRAWFFFNFNHAVIVMKKRRFFITDCRGFL